MLPSIHVQLRFLTHTFIHSFIHDDEHDDIGGDCGGSKRDHVVHGIAVVVSVHELRHVVATEGTTLNISSHLLLCHNNVEEQYDMSPHPMITPHPMIIAYHVT